MRKVALLLVAAPLALAACGSASATEVHADPVAYVKHAASKTAAQKSEHMNLTISVSAPNGTLSVKGTGDFENSPPKGHISVTASTLGHHEGTFDVVIEGTSVYTNLPLDPSNSKTWAKVDARRLGHATHLSMMSQSPTDALRRLEAAGTVTQVGKDTIDGSPTTHFQVTNLDLSKLSGSAKVGGLLQRAQLGPIDVWVGNSNGYVYREALKATVTEAGQTGTVTLRVDFSNFGEPVIVNVPSADETFDLAKSHA